VLAFPLLQPYWSIEISKTVPSQRNVDIVSRFSVLIDQDCWKIPAMNTKVEDSNLTVST